MTSISVKGVEYDFDAAPFIGDLRLLQKEFGFGWATVNERIAKIPVGTKWADVFSDELAGEALIAKIWMVMLRGGDRSVTRGDVERVPADEIRFFEPRPPADEAADPTSARTGSAPGDEQAPAAKPTRSTSKTSKPRSPRASR